MLLVNLSEERAGIHLTQVNKVYLKNGQNWSQLRSFIIEARRVRDPKNNVELESSKPVKLMSKNSQNLAAEYHSFRMDLKIV